VVSSTADVEGHHTPGVKRPRIALLGGFGVGNLGNDASLLEMVQWVQRCEPEALIMVLCPGPATIQQRYHLPALPTRAHRPDGRIFAGRAGRLLRLPYRLVDVARAVRLAGSIDALIVPGTGILDDYGGEKPSGWPLTLLLWIGAARLRGARTALVAIGAGPLGHPLSRYLAKAVSRTAGYLSLRDQTSRDFMRSTGLVVPEDRVAADIVFSSVAPTNGDAMTVRRPLVAVCVMKYRGWDPAQWSGGIGDMHIRNMVELSAWLLKEGYRVRLVTADAGDASATEKVAFGAHALAPRLAQHFLEVAKADSLADLMDLLLDAKAVVATRYHSVISALICGKPTISIGYAEKNDELMASVGLGEFCQHVEHLDMQRLQMQILDLMENEDRLCRLIDEYVGRHRRRLQVEEACVRQHLARSVRE
jgi:polysaccharide pyruvyl transferase WcaK-like protein